MADTLLLLEKPDSNLTDSTKVHDSTAVPQTKKQSKTKAQKDSDEGYTSIIDSKYSEGVKWRADNFLRMRDSLLLIYGEQVGSGEMETAVGTLRQLDTVFYGYIQMFSIYTLAEYIKPFNMRQVLLQGADDFNDENLHEKNEGYIELLMFTQDVFKEYLIDTQLPFMD